MTSRIPISRMRTARMPRFAVSRSPTQVSRRSYATEGPNTPNTPPAKPQGPTGAFYKSFGSPILKCFLGALFTYQVVYWAWMKLEAVEEKHDTEEEIQGLKEELKTLLKKKMEAEKKAAEEGQGVVAKAEEKPKKKGWW